jgi:TonB family protein
MNRVTIIAGMLLLVVWGGCATGDPGHYGELGPPRSALEGLAGRRCEYVVTPPPPTTLDLVTRPGTRGGILLWAGAASAADTVQLSVRYGTEGRLSWVRIIETSGSVEGTAARAVELRGLLEGALDESGPADWGFRIQVVGRDVAILPSVACEPEVAGVLGRVPAPLGTAYEQAEAREAMRRPMEVRVSLDELGRVVGVRVSLSSGSRLLDEYAMEVARAYRYEPKLHDGLPVASTMPLRIRAARRF